MPSPLACPAREMAFFELREEMKTLETPRPARKASRCVRPCVPAPTTSSGPLGTRGQFAGGEHGEGCGAPRGDDAAFEEAEPLARCRVHHDDLALYDRQATSRVLGVDRDQLGDGELQVRGWHDKQDTAFLM
jgi:hypothetical protein